MAAYSILLLGLDGHLQHLKRPGIDIYLDIGLRQDILVDSCHACLFLVLFFKRLKATFD